MDFAYQAKSLDIYIIPQIHLASTDHGLDLNARLEQNMHLIGMEGSTMLTPPHLKPSYLENK